MIKIITLLLVSFSLSFCAVDLNNATKEELISLKGIGAKKAKKIIKYRQKHCFKTLKDLKKVKGISKKQAKKIIKKNKANIAIGECKIKQTKKVIKRDAQKE
jgi:competence protein ComEA